MVNLIPKINVIYFKNILDDVIVRFFNEFGDGFRKESEYFVLAKSLTNRTLKKKVLEYIRDEILKYVSSFDQNKPEYFFIIGSCFPNDNILLEHIDPFQYFPKKLSEVIERNKGLKYVLKEADIKIDIYSFNELFEEIFNEFFNRKLIHKLFNGNSKNLFFIKNKKLDCYMMYRIIKYIYGKVNVCNLNKLKRKDSKSPIKSINELIDLYIKGKKELIKSSEFESVVSDVQNYIQMCMNGDVK